MGGGDCVLAFKVLLGPCVPCVCLCVCDPLLVIRCDAAEVLRAWCRRHLKDGSKPVGTVLPFSKKINFDATLNNYP